MSIEVPVIPECPGAEPAALRAAADLDARVAAARGVVPPQPLGATCGGCEWWRQSFPPSCELTGYWRPAATPACPEFVAGLERDGE